MTQETLDDLERDMDWRRAEIAYLRKQEFLSRDSSSGSKEEFREEVYLRLLVSMLYAHHEGFACRCWEAVYAAIDESSVGLRGLRQELRLFVLADAIKKTRNAPGIEIAQIFSGEIDPYPSEYEFNLKCPVKSSGNLKKKPYQESFRSLGIDIEVGSQEGSLLDQLVDWRNDVAHGRSLRRDVTGQLDEVVKVIFALQDRSFLAVRQYVLNEEFRVPAASVAVDWPAVSAASEDTDRSNRRAQRGLDPLEENSATITRREGSRGDPGSRLVPRQGRPRVVPSCS